MKLNVLYMRTAWSRGQASPQVREALLRAGWQRLHPSRSFPAKRFQHTVEGQPYLPGEAFSFSLSHADGLSVLACAPEGRIGVDLAHAPDAVLAAQLSPSFFTPAEQQALAQRLFTPLQLWSRKEAVLKAAGSGLLLDPGQAEVSGASSQVLGRGYWLRSTAFLDEYELSLATEWAAGPPELTEYTEVR